MLMETDTVDGVMVVKVTSDSVDASNAKNFKSEFAAVVGDEKHVVVDLAQVEFLDSSGLGALLSCLRNLKADGGDLVLCGLTAPVQSLFELVRMNRIFAIYGDRDEAVRSRA